MKKIKAFISGFFEATTDVTTYFNEDLIYYYDCGRDFFHRITFRKFDY